MIDPRDVLTGVCSMLLLMIPGFLLVKFKLIPAQLAKDVSKIILFSAQPCMIIAAFFREFSSDLVGSMLRMLILSLFAFVLMFAIALWMFPKAPEQKRAVLRYMMIFSNCGFMGFPMLQAIFNEELASLAIFHGAILTFWFNIFSWLLGIKLFSPAGTKVKVSKLFLNPGVIGVAIGAVVFVTSAVNFVPGFVQKSVDIMGSVVTPLSMLVIGMRLTEVKFKDIFKDKAMLLAHGMKLIALPALLFFALRLISLTGFIEPNGLVLTVIFILFAMPSAANTVMMAELFDGDSVYASVGVTVSTVLSLITIPLLSLLLLIPA